jgi:hypothetical protein
MSMQMAKRVSLSRLWGLNRPPCEIEPLGSHCTDPRGDRTHRSGWLDAGPQHSVLGSAPRVPLVQRRLCDSNCQNSALFAVKRWPDVPETGSDVPVPCLLTHALAASPTERTRCSPWNPSVRSLPVSIQRRKIMTGRVWSSPAFLCVPQMLTSAYVMCDWTQALRVRSHSLFSVRTWRLSCAPLSHWSDTPSAESDQFMTSVRSMQNNTSSSPTSPPLIKCANHQVYHLVHVC